MRVCHPGLLDGHDAARRHRRRRRLRRHSRRPRLRHHLRRSRHPSRSPPQLALSAARLRLRDGGLGLSNHSVTRYAAYANTFLATWPTCCRVCPDLSAISLATPDPRHHHATVAFADAYDRLHATLTKVRQRFARLDATVRYWVDGSKHSAYHPVLKKKTLSLPPRNELARTLRDAANTTTPPRFKQAQLAAILTCDAWLDTLVKWDAFDAANADATVPHREATRFVSASQPGPGAAPDGCIVFNPSFIPSSPTFNQSGVLVRMCCGSSCTGHGAPLDPPAQAAERIGFGPCLPRFSTNAAGFAGHFWRGVVISLS